jgi:pilus assembly protein Flp/PilA
MLFAAQEKGQGLVEYALIIVLIAIVVIAALTLLGSQITGVFDRISGELGNH